MGVNITTAWVCDDGAGDTWAGRAGGGRDA